MFVRVDAPLLTRRIPVVWITLAAAGASDAACNAILGNQAHELARSATEDGSATTDGPADTFDGPAEGEAPSASVDANASTDAAGEMDGLADSSDGAFDSGTGDDSAADAVDSQASPQDAPNGPHFDASDATGDDASREASDGATDAMRDAATCANGISSLSNIGTQDFHISFRILTTQCDWVALLNQRSVCSTGYFWDIRQYTTGNGCPAEGGIFVETDNNDVASLQTISAKGPINDGKVHEVVVARTAGMLTIQIDGSLSAGIVSVASFGTAMPPVQVGKDVCAPPGDPTVALTGTLSALCITSP
jgi:hypothetical protein